MMLSRMGRAASTWKLLYIAMARSICSRVVPWALAGAGSAASTASAAAATAATGRENSRRFICNLECCQ
jgi:hypothetical protein